MKGGWLLTSGKVKDLTVGGGRYPLHDLDEWGASIGRKYGQSWNGSSNILGKILMPFCLHLFGLVFAYICLQQTEPCVLSRNAAINLNNSRC